MLRPSPNHGTQRLPNDDDDDELIKLDLIQITHKGGREEGSMSGTSIREGWEGRWR